MPNNKNKPVKLRQKQSKRTRNNESQIVKAGYKFPMISLSQDRSANLKENGKRFKFNLVEKPNIYRYV